MKKKIMMYILFVIIAIAFVGVLCFGVKGREGYYIETNKDFHIFLSENTGLITMSSKLGDEMFDKYNTGDKIKIISGGIMESYPAQARVYFCIKLKDGDSNNISKEVWEELKEYGCME